jgi:hemerythrin-like domain-containing protein
MANPIYSLKLVHNALAKELEDLRTQASDPDRVAGLSESLSFFRELMGFHHAGEEAAIFPLMDERAESYLAEHEEERAHLEALERKARTASGGGDFDHESFVAELGATVAAGLAHIEKENSQVIPELAERFTPPQQAEIVGKIVAAIPKEKMSAIVPWIVHRQNDDDAEAYIRGLMAGMPAPVFAAAKGWLREGLPEARWDGLCERVPELRA